MPLKTVHFNFYCKIKAALTKWFLNRSFPASVFFIFVFSAIKIELINYQICLWVDSNRGHPICKWPHCQLSQIHCPVLNKCLTLTVEISEYHLLLPDSQHRKEWVSFYSISVQRKYGTKERIALVIFASKHAAWCRPKKKKFDNNKHFSLFLRTRHQTAVSIDTFVSACRNEACTCTEQELFLPFKKYLLTLCICSLVSTK